MGGAAELGDRHGLPLRDQRADAVAVPVRDLARPVGVHGDEVEGRPVHTLERDRGVGDPPAEPLPDERGRLAEEVVDAGREHGDRLAQLRVGRAEDPQALLDGVAGKEPQGEQAQLGAGDEHDLGAPPAEPLGAVGAVGQEVEQLVGSQVAGEGGEPDLQAGLCGERRRGLEPVWVAAGDAHGVAVQVVADDP